MNYRRIYNGMNLREAIIVAKDLGIEIIEKEGTGELIFSLPGYPMVRVNARKKSAPRALVALLRRAGYGSHPTSPGM